MCYHGEDEIMRLMWVEGVSINCRSELNNLTLRGGESSFPEVKYLHQVTISEEIPPISGAGSINYHRYYSHYHQHSQGISNEVPHRRLEAPGLGRSGATNGGLIGETCNHPSSFPSL